MSEDHVAKMLASKAGAEIPTTKVTRQEELLYEEFAGLVRRMGNIAVEAEAARGELDKILAQAREGDQLTAGVVRKPDGWDPETGTTKYTRWVEGLYTTVWDLSGDVYRGHRDVAHEAADVVMWRRNDIQSLPAPKPVE